MPLDIDWNLAEEISLAVHGEWSDESVDTAESINDDFNNINEIVELIMVRDSERKNEGWGRGALKRAQVSSVVRSFLA